MKRQFRNSAIILASCLALSAGAFGCVEQKTSHYEGVHAFKVVATPLSGSYGTTNDPLKMPTSFTGAGAYKVKLQAWAVDINGNVLDGSVDPETGIARDAYNETVKLSVEPGKLSSETITFKNGVAEINDLAIRYAFGTVFGSKIPRFVRSIWTIQFVRITNLRRMAWDASLRMRRERRKSSSSNRRRFA